MGYAGEVEWMNKEGSCLLGFTAQREKWASNGFMSLDSKTGQYRAWWQHEDFKGSYPGPIPVEDLQRRMLNWVPQEGDILVRKEVFPHPTEEVRYDDETVDPDTGRTRYWLWIPDNERKAIIRPDEDVVFGYVGQDTFQMHDYTGIVKQCENIADGELGLASAFLMDKGGVFIANMELPEDITTDTGIDHRVRLMVFTSLNQRFVTTWKLVDEFCVCSNSFRLNLAGAGNEFKVKHSSKSLGKINDARQALGLVYKATEEYTKFLDAMTKVDVTDAQFRAIISTVFPMPDVKTNVDGEVSNKSAITRMETRHAELMSQLGKNTAKPWAGTLFGAFQAWSTWNQHDRPRGDSLASSIMGTVDDRLSKQDAEFFAIVRNIDGIDLRPLAEVKAA